jgi:hypothetical protein
MRDTDGVWRQKVAMDDVSYGGSYAEDGWDTDPDAEIESEIRLAATLKQDIDRRAAAITFLRDAERKDPSRSKMRTLAEFERQQRKDILRLREVMAVVDGYHHPEIDRMPEIEVHDGPLPTTSLELDGTRGLLH